jgi:sulfatase modifying factor 1
LKAGATKPLGQTGITLVYVPAGEFLMGSPDSGTYEDQKPQHRVYLDAYWIGQTEVTNAQFRQFIDAGGYDNRIYWSDEGWQWLESNRPMKPSGWGDIGWTSPEHPVVGVSWYEAEAFARWAGGRLPTEAEWEYAARGGPLSAGYLYAGGNNPDEVMWYADNSGGTPHPVATKEANELGLYDMSGNAYEWVADWYGKDYYAQSPRQNPTGPSSGPGRVRRGGSWTWDQTSERCASRNWQDPTYKFLDAGFRVAVGISIRQPPDAVVKQDDVELREGPSSVYGVVGTYGQGTELVVLGRSSGKQWLKVSAPDAKLGWMRVEYLQVNVAIDSLEVGSAPPSPTPLPSPTPPGPPAGTTKVLQPSGLVLVWVRGGEFWMGSADTDPDGYPDEKPQHRVYVDGFWIG